MSTLTIPENSVALFRAAPNEVLNFVRNPDGTGTIRDVKVFRAGKFKDSRGVRGEWTAEHLQMIVNNFTKLRDRLPNIPAKVGHERKAENVIGYFSSMRTDGTLLYADIAFTEPEALNKIERGTYRNRSFEVGLYEDNDGNRHWPVAMGLAYVDLPAVEGLYSAHIGESDFTFTTPESEQMTEEQMKQWFAAFYAKGLEDAPKPTAAGEPAKFALATGETTDPVAVQTYISALETFQKEALEGGRKAFVAKLATDKKILATQVEGLSAFALSLNDSQFEAFKATQEALPVQTVLANHGAGGGGGSTSVEDAKADRIEVLEGIIRNHELAGAMSQAEIFELSSYKELQTLKTAK